MVPKLTQKSNLHIHLHIVHLEDADITELADFVGIEEFHATCAFVEVVFEGDAAVPVLDGAVACPEGEVDVFPIKNDESIAMYCLILYICKILLICNDYNLNK